MPTLNSTPNRNYPEPFLGNDLATDVGRIISALRAIDADVADAFAQIVDLAPKTSPTFTGTPTAPTAVAGTQTNQLATTAFVAAALAALVDSSPDALNTLNELAAALDDDPNFAATITNLIATKADAAATTAALAGKADVTDLKWMSKAVGEFYWADDGVAGVDIPPSGTGGSTVWVELTSGLTGSGQFNQNKLTSETVTGTAPLVSATAVVSLSGSPMNGQTIRLLNTERRVLRAGSAGTVQDDAFQGHRFNIAYVQDASGGTRNMSAGPNYPNGTTSGDPVTDGSNGTPRTANETRMKNIGVRVFRRIK